MRFSQGLRSLRFYGFFCRILEILGHQWAAYVVWRCFGKINKRMNKMCDVCGRHWLGKPASPGWDQSCTIELPPICREALEFLLSAISVGSSEGSFVAEKDTRSSLLPFGYPASYVRGSSFSTGTTYLPSTGLGKPVRWFAAEKTFTSLFRFPFEPPTLSFGVPSANWCTWFGLPCRRWPTFFLMAFLALMHLEWKAKVTMPTN